MHRQDLQRDALRRAQSEAKQRTETKVADRATAAATRIQVRLCFSSARVSHVTRTLLLSNDDQYLMIKALISPNVSQRVFRGFAARKRMVHVRDQEMVFLHMNPTACMKMNGNDVPRNLGIYEKVSLPQYSANICARIPVVVQLQPL